MTDEASLQFYKDVRWVGLNMTVIFTSSVTMKKMKKLCYSEIQVAFKERVFHSDAFRDGVNDEEGKTFRREGS